MLESTRALLEGIVDYAGLFPPATCGMGDAVSNYLRHRSSADQALLGAFVLGAGRLDDFVADLEGRGAALDRPIPVSLVVKGDVLGQLERARKTAEGRPLEIVALEAAPDPGADAARLVQAAGDDLPVFFEIPWQDSVDDAIERVGEAGGLAKIRTGGVTEDLIPPTQRVARFVETCAVQGVGFKATAGLHHPLRGDHPLSYADDAPRGTMHGFLTLALAATFRRQGQLTFGELPPLLEEKDPKSIVFGDDGVTWKACHAPTVALLETRQKLFRSFGSCSFDEPTADLHAMGLLP